jgi:hypothetical protein
MPTRGLPGNVGARLKMTQSIVNKGSNFARVHRDDEASAFNAPTRRRGEHRSVPLALLSLEHAGVS